MSNRISGFQVVDAWQRRVFTGVVADLWNVRCAPLAGGSYIASDPRLFVVLETQGEQGRNMAMSPSPAGALKSRPCRRLSYIPAGMELWAELDGVRSIRHLDLHFDVGALSRRLGEEIDPLALEQARLMFSDPRLLSIAELIAADCADPDPLHDLYGDSLVLSLFVALMGMPPVSERRRRGALAPWQLRRVTAFIEAQCLRGIRLEELAMLTGLSQSHFSQAFKASTGLPPHQWQMKARIERAKILLSARQGNLSEVAAETGFADQAHFTRAFRRVVGITPGQWQRSRKA